MFPKTFRKLSENFTENISDDFNKLQKFFRQGVISENSAENAMAVY